MRIIITLIMLLSAPLAWGTTYPVGPGETYTTIQACLDAIDLAPGDIVEIQAGTYTESVAPEADDIGDSGDQLFIQGRYGNRIDWAVDMSACLFCVGLLRLLAGIRRRRGQLAE